MTPLVLLPPFPFDVRMFGPLITALGDRPLITPEPTCAGPPDLDASADQVVAELDRRGIGRAHIGGVSMGGYAALAVLRRHPDRVAGLVLIDTKATADTPEARDTRLATADRADAGERPDASSLVAGMVAPVTRDTRPDLMSRLTRWVDDQPLASVAWRQRAMAARPDSTAALAATDVPVLVIVGSEDALTPPATAAALAAGARRSTVREIPATGHLAVVEDPAAVAAAVVAWWEENR